LGVTGEKKQKVEEREREKERERERRVGRMGRCEEGDKTKSERRMSPEACGPVR
jgi:hypothetical protein